jgi:HlyD family secretion protein
MVFILLLAAMAGLWYRQTSRPAPKANMANPRTAKVRRGPLERTLRLSGITVAEKFSTLIVPQLFGGGSHYSNDFLQVLSQLVAPGSHVRKADVVAEFDQLYMRNRIDDYQAWVNQHESNIRRLNALLDVKRKAYEQRIRAAKGAVEKAALDLKKAPVLSANKTELFRLNLEEARARYLQLAQEAKYVDISEKAAIRRTELSLKQSQVEFNRAHRNLERMVVRAPIDGLAVMQTTRRGNDTGEIQQGDQLYPGQPYMQIVDLSSMAIDAPVNQVDTEQLRIGARARVSFDAYPGLELPAHIVNLGAFARARGWRGSYVKDIPLRLKLDKLDGRVLPNLSVSVDVILAWAEPAPLVPLECVFYEGNQPVAYVRAEDEWEKRPLELGLQNNIAASVLSGLQEGEVVAAEVPIP